MSPDERPAPGDRARISVLVAVEREAAFRIFTEEIDQWWRRGAAYRAAGRHAGVIRLEPGVGGRFYESIETLSGTKFVEMGRVTAWDPPSRLAFDWRGANLAPSEKTEVEVVFEAGPGGTLVTVTHRGWSRIRGDHPARHGLAPAAFIRMMGLWWGELMTAMRQHAAREGRESG